MSAARKKLNSRLSKPVPGSPLEKAQKITDKGALKDLTTWIHQRTSWKSIGGLRFHLRGKMISCDGSRGALDLLCTGKINKAIGKWIARQKQLYKSGLGGFGVAAGLVKESAAVVNRRKQAKKAAAEERKRKATEDRLAKMGRKFRSRKRTKRKRSRVGAKQRRNRRRRRRRR